MSENNKKSVSSESRKIKELEQEKIIFKELYQYLSSHEKFSKKIFDAMSHELRTPTVTIKAYTEMLLDTKFGDLTPQQTEKLERIKKNIDLLIGSISSLLHAKDKQQDILDEVEILKKEDSISVEGDSIAKKYEELKKQFDQKSSDYIEQVEQLQQLTHKVLELRQEKMMFESFNDLTKSEKDEMEKTLDVMRQKFETERKTLLEQEQKKLFIEKSLELETQEKKKVITKYHKTIIIAIFSILVITVVYSMMFAELAGQQYSVEMEPRTTGYTIQNLRGDTIDTYLSWRLVEGATLVVNILNADKFDDEIIDTIKKVILSEEILEIDNSLLHKGPKGTTSLLYVGWKGAMSAAAKTETLLYVPVNFDVISSKTGEGDITIELSKAKNADGFSG